MAKRSFFKKPQDYIPNLSRYKCYMYFRGAIVLASPLIVKQSITRITIYNAHFNIECSALSKSVAYTDLLTGVIVLLSILSTA